MAQDRDRLERSAYRSVRLLHHRGRTHTQPMENQMARSLEQLAAFVAVVEADGFSAAARIERTRKATLSLRVRQLETRLGVSLLVRTTRSLRLTDEGQAYLEHARVALIAARDAEAVVARARSEPSGRLRVTASAALASMVLERVVSRYLARHASVSLELDTSTRTVDLVRERFDLALRVGPLADSSLVARKLGTSAGGYYASARYLEQHGEPANPDALREHATICVPREGAPKEWFFTAGTKRRSLLLRPRLLVSSFELAMRAAVADGGIVRAPRYFAAPYLAKKKLVPVLTDWTPRALDVHAVYAPGATSVPKTRAFLDLLDEWFDDHGRAV